jgi:MOSC domain-containing protein YiiM
MKSFEELDRLWSMHRVGRSGPRAGLGLVRQISRRLGGGIHEPLASAELSVEGGLVGDRWSASEDPERLCQITFMSALAAECVSHAAQPPLAAGDNFYVDLDLSESALPAGTRVRLGSAERGLVLLEVTPEPHLGCAKFRERFGPEALRWVNHKDGRSERRRGVNLRVLSGGQVQVGDLIEVLAPER